MAVRKGEDWGQLGPLPEDGIVVATDAEARALVERARQAHEPLPTLGLVGGDLRSTLGGRRVEHELRSPDAARVQVDIVRVEIDGEPHWFVAHLIAHASFTRGGWWRGRTLAAMNAAWRGSWNVGPRAHPGDGLVDVLDADLSVGDRWKARHRLPLGTHVPHPGISMRRSAQFSLTCDPPLSIWLDGTPIGQARSVVGTVEPSALTVVV
jgi:diacylglycerol kinase family enzyme